MMEAEDKLKEVGYLLSGDSLKSPGIKSKEEAKYQKGTVIYKNNLLDLMETEGRLIKIRNYHLEAVSRIVYYLQQLTDDEVELIELRYWYGYSLKVIGDMYFLDKSVISRKIYKILLNLQHVAYKNMV